MHSLNFLSAHLDALLKPPFNTPGCTSLNLLSILLDALSCKFNI